MLALGVPTLRRYDLLESLLSTAKESERQPDEYVIVDNGGSLGERRWLDPEMQVVVPGRNLGVAGGWNEIMRRSQGDHVLIVGDDVRLHRDTLGAMEAVANTGAGFVRAGSLPAFHCFLITRWFWEKIGPFDERFWPAYFEDNDYIRRMTLMGHSFAVAPVGYAHVGSATIKSFSDAEMNEHHARFEANRQRYIRKWGGPPDHETLMVPNV